MMETLTMLTLFLPSHILASYDYNNWIAPSPTLPRDVFDAAVGYDSINNAIWILGSDYMGYEPQQLISYDIDSNLVTDYNATALSHNVYGYSEFYTQIDDILYMIDPLNGDKLSTFNVNTAQFTYYYQNIDIPHGVGTYGCLASIDDVLFVLGGGTSEKHVQVLNLTTR
eukprot:926851_1